MDLRENLTMHNGGIWIECNNRTIAIYNLKDQGPVIGLYGTNKSFMPLALCLSSEDEPLIQIDYHGEPKHISLVGLYDMLEYHKQNRCGFAQ